MAYVHHVALFPLAHGPNAHGHYAPIQAGVPPAHRYVAVRRTEKIDPNIPADFERADEPGLAKNIRRGRVRDAQGLQSPVKLRNLVIWGCLTH